MPRLSPVEHPRSEHNVSYMRKRRRTLLSPKHCLSKISTIDSSGWEMCDDYRVDRFSENYYRHFHGLHKGGMVFSLFLGMVLVVSGVVGVAFAA